MLLFLRFILLFCIVVSSYADTVVALSARPLKTSVHVKRAFGLSPPMNYLIYAIDPKKAIGLNFKAYNMHNGGGGILDKHFASLPVIGSFYGAGVTINLETLLKRKPQVVFVWKDGMLVDHVLKTMHRFDLPTVLIDFLSIKSMPQAFITAGDALQERVRGKELAAYAQKTIDRVRNFVKMQKPVTYYYAEGRDGLLTECDDSFHVVAMNFAGGKNVDTCKQSNLVGLERINFETLLSHNPDVILVQNPHAYKKILRDPLWGNLQAVKQKRVYLIPNKPFNWVDRPPSFMRVIAIDWLTHIFYPKTYKEDLQQNVQEFYKLFFHVRLGKTQIQSILGENE
jgi:iron complex transport system substrate-binding protein